MSFASRFIRLVATTLLVCFASATAAAPPKLVPLEGVAYQVGAGMAENLRSLTGQTVTVRLRGASVVTGVVKDVGDHMLHLQTLEQREHFDALVVIKEIVAIETRFRQFQR